MLSVYVFWCFGVLVFWCFGVLGASPLATVSSLGEAPKNTKTLKHQNTHLTGQK